MNLMRKAVLQLNSSYEALRIVSARRAMTLICKGKAVVEVPTDLEIYPGIFLPSVIRLRNYRHVPVRTQILTRKHIYIRDQYTCQYCGGRFSGDKLTLDHVIPRSQGGRNLWENLVSCCQPCNRKKDNMTPEQANMPLLRRPMPANVHTPRALVRALGSDIAAWRPYLFHDNEGDRRYGAFVN